MSGTSINSKMRATAGVLVLAAFAAATSAIGAGAESTLAATYTISFGGVTIGTADADGRFTDTSYEAAIEGTTSGISRLLSDASAKLSASGRIGGRRLAPASYDLEIREGEFETHVRMKIDAGAITDLLAIPSLHGVRDRVPLEPGHKRNVVDPIAAFIIVAGEPRITDGRSICRRTIKVFDGWQRFDIRFTYEDTRVVEGTGDGYDGDVVVCAARYVPVAGHRTGLETTSYMAENQRLEVWFAPVKSTRLLVPYRILIGTKFGDLVVRATRFVATGLAAKPEAED